MPVLPILVFTSTLPPAQNNNNQQLANLHLHSRSNLQRPSFIHVLKHSIPLSGSRVDNHIHSRTRINTLHHTGKPSMNLSLGNGLGLD